MATYKVRIQGTSSYLQHRYPMPDEEQKFKGECEEKGLDPKKTSNIEASWYSNSTGAYIPSEHVKQSITGAGKSQKVAGKGNATWNNIIKVSVAVLPAEIPFDPPRSKYDEVHKAYVKVGNARVLRERPCFHKGWEAVFEVAADSGDIDEKNLRKFVEKAGMRGIGDYRPEKGGSYGTFKVVSFERIEA